MLELPCTSKAVLQLSSSGCQERKKTLIILLLTHPSWFVGFSAGLCPSAGLWLSSHLLPDFCQPCKGTAAVPSVSALL